MHGESDAALGSRSKRFAARLRHAGTIVHQAHAHIITHIGRHFCAFGRAVAGLWPAKPAAHLAHLAGISERNANQLLTGDRKVTAKAMHAFEGELLDG